MARIPMTAKEQLRLARAAGHELTVNQRGPWPEHGDPHPKFYASCSCGWEAKAATRTRQALNFTIVRHLGQAVADALDQSNPRAAAVARSAEPRRPA